MSKQSYKLFDIVMLTVIACVIEGVITFLSNQTRFLVEGFAVSFTVVFALIGMFRWNILGVIPGVGASLTAIIVQSSVSGTATDFGYSTGRAVGIVLGVLSTALLIFYFKFFSKKKIKENLLLLGCYPVAAYFLYVIVCFICILMIDKYPVDVSFTLAFNGSLLNLVMAILVLFIANKQRDFLVDMEEYLLYLHTVPDSIRLRKEINEDKPQSLMSEVVGSDEVNDIALLDGGTLSEEDLIKLNKTFKEKEGENYHGTRKS